MKEKEQKQQERKECEVSVNKDPAQGPLDGASATVNVAKTVFAEDGEHFSQMKLVGNVRASYELGVVSISVPSERVMLAVRLDELMQVMFASAGAYRKLEEQKTRQGENSND